MSLEGRSHVRQSRYPVSWVSGRIVSEDMSLSTGSTAVDVFLSVAIPLFDY